MICDHALSEIALMQRERKEWGEEVPKSRPVDSPALKNARQAVATATADGVVDPSEEPIAAAS
jgi:tellurite resistance protein